jgi:2-keto-4-pentenoate hydratase/2-oxohepta-3-ene-1,7-dioic acid hydratase in catechol pathway
MRLVTFSTAGGSPRLGAMSGDRVLDLNEVSAGEVPATMLELLAQGDAGMERARDAVKRSSSGGVALADVKLLSPIPRPPKNVMAIGLNYREHAIESATAKGQPVVFPSVPVIFTKAATSVIGPDDAIEIDDDVTKQVDWETELAVVIGARAKNVSKSDAFSYIAGYTAANDVSARDLQFAHVQFFRGKSLDTFCPLGPWLVTRDELPDPSNLAIKLRVNGVTKQDSSTAELIFDVPSIIETLSSGTTLEPGDVILTGTPSGVGFARSPQEFLMPGDVVEVEIEGIGVLRNPVTAAR